MSMPRIQKTKTPCGGVQGDVKDVKDVRREIEDRRTGDDRLSRVLRQSTIGAKGFHGRVRNGIGWDTFAITGEALKNFVKSKKSNPPA